MKDNKLILQVNVPLPTLFTFTTDPANTHKWVDSIVKEETNEWLIKVGTMYKNQNKEGIWSKYTVVDYKANKLFELISKDKNYHVRYTYKSVDDNTSELEYYEWVDNGALEGPFMQEDLNKLKIILEKS